MNKELLKQKLMEYREKARGDTGNSYYDKSYSGLLLCGQRIAASESEISDVITLAHGIAGWNRGYGSAPRSAILIENYEDNQLTSLIKVIREVEESSSDFREKITLAITQAQHALGITTISAITEASKLLHFMSPWRFPPLDGNVLSVLDRGKSRESFVEYASSLLELGFGRAECIDKDVRSYWNWCPDVSPIRAVDCTLYIAGKR